MSTFEGSKVECRFLSVVAHTRKAMGGDKRGFCVGFAEDAKRS
jgi:hypothetical protein